MAVFASTKPGAVGSADEMRVTLRFPAALTYRPVAVALVSVLIQQVKQADGEFRNGMVTAFGEAFNNIVIHAYRGRHDGMIEIEAEMTADRMTLRLIDTGQPNAVSGVRPPDLEALPESGMGVFMIQSLVDDVNYKCGPPNVLSLIKRTTSAGGVR